ncbi:DUF2059 domain-containing protein [Seonamhaeicola aphaedonensis]|uniref:DUF2059 domain-containing protein n=1 Tax=Seonamhaeicola aphaedonensis TaxID=1461338 RepID=A0A3D9HHE3_9FLAO|nr:DUF2059 domain-containing protein [Seonamhaeicola aphaedonensis]RED48917.1 hypothetical protein DFQ02_103248 [Seonamhaeicola aphaedonensis]
MKKTILVFALIFTLFLQAQDSEDFKIETIEFIKLTGSGAAFENAIDQLGMMVSETNKEAYLKEAEATLGGIYNKIAELYMEEFTKEEIKELTAFYNTDLGKKLAEKQLGLAQKSMMAGQTWGMEVQAIAQKYK